MVYVRGTPACGKTILATLLRRYTEAHHPTIHVSQMSWAPDPDRTWDNILKFKCNITFNKQDFGTLRNHLIIVDEVQSSFNDVTFWSEFIKMLAQSRNRNWPMVVMFGSFGSPTQGPSLDTTPVDFPPDQRVSLQPNIEALPPPCSLVSQSLCLFFNRAEYEDTLRHAEKHTSLNNLPMTLAKDLQDHIWNLTYGHPGAVGAILKILDHHPRLGYFKVKGTQVPLEQALQIMEDTTSFSASLATTVFSRSWPRIPEIQADPKLALFLEEVVATRGLPANKKNTTEQRICHRNGWLHIEAQPVRTARGLVGTKVIYVFPTPLHHKLLEHHFFTPDFPKDRFKTVDDLLLASLKNFRRVNLREPHMRTGGRTPVEAQYQDELYRACWETFGQKLYLTSEYTPPEKKGRIDFFLESPKWGIECVRDGSQFNDHIRRFLPKHGQYCPWIESGLMEQFVLVDFRDTKPVIDPSELNTYFLIYLKLTSKRLPFLGLLCHIFRLVQSLHRVGCAREGAHALFY